MQIELSKRNVSVDEFPCVHIAYYSTQTCNEHPNLRECTKSVVLRTSRFDEYFISSRESTGDDSESMLFENGIEDFSPRLKRFNWRHFTSPKV
jgi:hypothetical protein